MGSSMAAVRALTAAACALMVAGNRGPDAVVVYTEPEVLNEETVRAGGVMYVYIQSKSEQMYVEHVKRLLPKLFTAAPRGCAKTDQFCDGPGFYERMPAMLDAERHDELSKANVQCTGAVATETPLGRMCEEVRIKFYNDRAYDITSNDTVHLELIQYAAHLFENSHDIDALFPHGRPSFTILPKDARLKIWEGKSESGCSAGDPCDVITTTGKYLVSGDFVVSLLLEGDRWDVNNFHAETFASTSDHPHSFNAFRNDLLGEVYFPKGGRASIAQLTFEGSSRTAQYGLEKGVDDVIEVCGSAAGLGRCSKSLESQRGVSNSVKIIVTAPWPTCSGPNYKEGSCDECGRGYFGPDCKPCPYCSGNGWCPPGEKASCTQGCLDGPNGTGACMCQPGYEGEFCDEQHPIATTGAIASTSTAGAVVMQVLAGGSPAAPIVAVSQLQFFVLLAGEECAPQEMRDLMSRVTRIVDPLYDKIQVSPDISDDANHLYVALVLLPVLLGIHAFITIFVFLMKKKDGWDTLDACNACRFPNLQLLAVAVCLANAVSSASAVFSRAGDHTVATSIGAGLILIAYGSFIVYVRKALAGISQDTAFPMAQYIDRNVANTDNNVQRIVYTTKRAEKMPGPLVWFLPLGFWTSEHMPERGYCKRWGYFFEEYTEEDRLYILILLGRLIALSIPLGLRLEGPDACKGKMWALLAISALFFLHFAHRRPYSSLGSNILHSLVLLSNVFILGSIISDMSAEGSATHAFLLTCVGILFVCAVWNALLFILGKTVYKVSHVASAAEDIGDEKMSILKEHGMDEAKTAFLSQEEVEDINYKIDQIAVDHCGKLIIHKSSMGFGSCLGSMCCVGKVGGSGNSVCWSEIRNSYLLYYENNQDRVQAPLGAVLLPFTKVARKKPGLCSCGGDEGAQLVITDVLTGSEMLVSVDPEEGDLELENWGKFLKLYSSSGPQVEGEGPMFSNRSRASFVDIEALGHGAFGQVMRVRDVDTQREYALKTLYARGPDRSTIMNEIAILQLVKHPFLVSLIEALQSPDSMQIHLVLQLLLGGDLASHLRHKRSFSLQQTQFYAAQIALALEHLHANNILYRDLKPANIVLDQMGRGNAVLVDMGVAHAGGRGQGADFDKAVTATFCGTFNYMAPEILNYWVYDNAVDWWAFGIVIYEMLVGSTPFESECQNITFQQIKTRPPMFPRGFPASATNLARLLLEKVPTQRLVDPKMIKAHDFFSEVDFQKLLKCELLPPEMEPLPRSYISAPPLPATSQFSPAQSFALSPVPSPQSASPRILERAELIKRAGTPDNYPNNSNNPLAVPSPSTDGPSNPIDIMLNNGTLSSRQLHTGSTTAGTSVSMDRPSAPQSIEPVPPQLSSPAVVVASAHQSMPSAHQSVRSLSNQLPQQSMERPVARPLEAQVPAGGHPSTSYYETVDEGNPGMRRKEQHKLHNPNDKADHAPAVEKVTE